MDITKIFDANKMDAYISSDIVPNNPIDILLFMFVRRRLWIKNISTFILYTDNLVKNNMVDIIVRDFFKILNMFNIQDATDKSAISFSNVIISNDIKDIDLSQAVITQIYDVYILFNYNIKAMAADRINHNISVLFTLFCAILDIPIKIDVKQQHINISYYTGFYPVSSEEDKTPVGIDIELMKLFVDNLNIRNGRKDGNKYLINFNRTNNWDNLWLTSLSSDADISVGGIGITPIRQEELTIVWSIPYFYVDRTFIYNKKMFPDGLTNITSDLEKKTSKI